MGQNITTLALDLDSIPQRCPQCMCVKRSGSEEKGKTDKISAKIFIFNMTCMYTGILRIYVSCNFLIIIPT